MKKMIAFCLLTAACSAFAEETHFAQPPSSPAEMAMPQRPAMPTDMLLPSYSENKSVFDVLEVVGRTDTHATLRYPQAGVNPTGGAGQPGSPAGGGAASLNFRVVTVKHGESIFLSGRKYKVALDKSVTLVRLLDIAQNRVIWEGDLSAPRTYSVMPNMTDYQYVPPVSAGAGVHVEGTASR